MVLLIGLLLAIALLTWFMYWVTTRKQKNVKALPTEKVEVSENSENTTEADVSEEDVEDFVSVEEKPIVPLVLSVGDPIIIKTENSEEKQEFPSTKADLSVKIYVSKVDDAVQNLEKNHPGEETLSLSCDCWEDWKQRTGQTLTEKQLENIAQLYNEEQAEGLLVMYSKIQETLYRRVRSGANWQKGCDMVALFFGMRIEALLKRAKSFEKTKKKK